MSSIAETLGAEFVRTCRADGADPAPPVAGLEHEFTLWAGDEQQDFRTLVHTRAWDGICIDPSDPNAYRCSWGGAVTADGREAEVVTPPMPMMPGFSERLIRIAATGRAVLAEQLPDLRLDGYSTHLSFEVPDRHVTRVARRFACHFAPPMMLLLERHDSRGVLIRPRRDRLELCGDFLSGPQLQAAIVFAAGAVQACASRRELPPRLRVTLAPSVHRFGTFVRRDAFRSDLYAEGRTAVLRTRSGRRITAQAHLEQAWAVARPHAAWVATTAELTLVDRVIAGSAPLAIERDITSESAGPSTVDAIFVEPRSARLIRSRLCGRTSAGYVGRDGIQHRNRSLAGRGGRHARRARRFPRRARRRAARPLARTSHGERLEVADPRPGGGSRPTGGLLGREVAVGARPPRARSLDRADRRRARRAA
jgi:hypothetical protein